MNTPDTIPFGQSKTADTLPFGGASNVSQPPTNSKSLAQNTWDTISGLAGQTGQLATQIFPGAQLGNAIGTGIAATGRAMKGDFQGMNDILKTAPSPLQVGADVAQGALTIAAPGIGKGAGALGRIGANAVLGAGLGATNAVAQGQGAGDVVKSTLTGGVLGGGLSAGAEGAATLTEKLPTWLTKLALPKLSQSKINPASPQTIDYALSNMKGVTLRHMVDVSNAAKQSYETQVQSILNHPEYANETGNISSDLIKARLTNFPNAQKDFIPLLKSVAPKNSAIVDKLAEGTANLAEQNTLRKELDLASKSRFTDSPKLTFAKQVGATVADALRNNVKTTAKETEPIFAKYSREIALNNALSNALGKKRVAGPLVAGAGGFAAGGIKGALEAIAVEEGLRSPTGKILAAKALNTANKVALPVGKALLQGGKAPVIKAATSQ